ncbi:hypothetical protein JCM18899A_45850 [Nocardioides sp. AN3]
MDVAARAQLAQGGDRGGLRHGDHATPSKQAEGLSACMSPPSAYRSRDGKGELHERSRFEQRAGRWLYVDGEVG